METFAKVKYLTYDQISVEKKRFQLSRDTLCENHTRGGIK